MSLLEIWGESVDPGQRGSVELSGEHEPCRWKLLVWARMLFLLFALPVVWGLAAGQMTAFSFGEALALVIGGTCLYVGLAYFVRPEPDLDNVGFLGGMIDHPWRWSDDWNRSLLSWRVLLGPGRFAAESLVDFALLFQQERDASNQESASGQVPAENLTAMDERRFQIEE